MFFFSDNCIVFHLDEGLTDEITKGIFDTVSCATVACVISLCDYVLFYGHDLNTDCSTLTLFSKLR